MMQQCVKAAIFHDRLLLHMQDLFEMLAANTQTLSPKHILYCCLAVKKKREPSDYSSGRSKMSICRHCSPSIQSQVVKAGDGV
jgi:hypothetical protein